MVEQVDLAHLVENILGTGFGDANLDGRFDSDDLIEVFCGGEYADNLEGNSTWMEGDWDGNGDFDSDDLLAALQAGGYSLAALPVKG